MSRLKIAIAGAGAISEFHLRGWRSRADVDICGLCDPDRESAKKRAEEFGIERVFTDVRQMLDQTNPDAIDIITPVGTHADLVRLAAGKRVHVMCQKPMTATVAEAEALIADVGETVRFMVHENYRFRPHYAEMARRVADGEVGNVRHARLTVRSSSLFDYPGKTPFLLGRQPYLAGFDRLLVFEILIHHLDALRSIFGEMDVTSAVLDRVNSDVKGEDVALVTLRSAAGATIVIDANVSAIGYPPLPTDRLEVLGDRDTLVLDQAVIRKLSVEEPLTVHDLKANYQACFTGAVNAFADGLITGAPFPTDRLDNLKTLKLMESVYRAAGIAV